MLAGKKTGREMSESAATVPATTNANSVSLIRGVQLFTLKTHQDERGTLAVLNRVATWTFPFNASISRGRNHRRQLGAHMPVLPSR